MKTLTDLKNKYKTYSSEQLIGVIASLHTTIESLAHQLHGKKSEKRHEDPVGMTPLFNEVEQENKAKQEDTQETEVKGHTRKKNRGKRRPLPDDLERRRVEYDLNDEEKICQNHNTPLLKIGEHISEQLEIIPAQVKVIQNVTFSYKCTQCSEENGTENIVTSTADPKPIPKSFASPSLLAHIAISKYCDALPLYRQEQIFQRYNIDLDRTTMARWMIRSHELAMPLLNLMFDELLERPVIGCDETPVQVLKEPRRRAEQKSYMWITRSFCDEPIILFQYFQGRSKKIAEQIFAEYSGVIVCDGLKTYDSLAKQQEQLVLAACLAHIRRKFYLAEKAAKKADPKATPKASFVLGLIRSLYQIEKKLEGEPPDKKLKTRQNESKPLMDEFKKCLDTQRNVVLPQSLIGKAVHYALGQWQKMLVFLDNPLVPIDNNPTEGAIRPFAIGRNNWKFSNAQDGAHASAGLYSLIESAKANKNDPHSFMNIIFKELPKAQSLEDYEKLMPHKIHLHFDVKPYNTKR